MRTAKNPVPPKPLRTRAERWLRQTRRDIARLTPEEVQKLVHELQVHQVELEMQNEELRQSQVGHMQALERYADLFDFSPVTYLTLNASGEIREINLSAAGLLGLERNRALGQKLTRFIAPESQDAFYLLCRRAFRSNQWQGTDLVLRTPADRRLVIHADAVRDPKFPRELIRISLTDITERERLAAVALKSSELKYQKLFESLRDAFVSVDMSGKIQEFNAAYCEMLGYTEEELRRLTYVDLTPKKWHAVEAAIVRDQILPRGFSGVYEKEYRRKDGTIFPVELRTFLIKDPAGKPAGMWAIIRDITGRRQAEERIRQLNQTLEQRVRERTGELTRSNLALQQEKSFSEGIISTAQTIILVLDREARIVRFNPFLEQLTGYRQEEVLGKNWFEVFLPETDWKHIRKVFQKTIAGQPTRGTINPIRLKDGTSRVIEWDNSPLKNERGRVVGLLAIGVDITERQRAAEALRRSEERFRVLFNSSRDGLLTLAPPDWKFSAGNPAAVEMFRARDASQLLAAAPWELSPAFQPNGLTSVMAAQAMIETALRQGSHVFEWSHRRFDGEEFYCSVLLNRVELAGEVFLQATLRDITERIRLQREVLEISERECRRIAGDLHDGLGQVLFGAACLTKSLQTDLAKKSLTEAQSLERIQTALNDALLHTRQLAAGLHPVNEEPNGLMVALQDLAEKIRQVFRIRCDFKCRQPVLIQNNQQATHLFRIVQEAVTNAIKHGRASRIRISLTRSPQRIKLAIKDNGLGKKVPRRKKSGMGVNIMHYRAGVIGGLLDIQNPPAGGTSVICRVSQR